MWSVTGFSFILYSISFLGVCKAQSRQSTKLFLQSLELGLPQPLTRTRMYPPFGSGGRDTSAGERGGGSVPIPIPTRGHNTLWYSLYVCTLLGKVSKEPGSVEGGLEEGSMHQGWQVPRRVGGGGGGKDDRLQMWRQNGR